MIKRMGMEYTTTMTGLVIMGHGSRIFKRGSVFRSGLMGRPMKGTPFPI